MPLAAKSKSFGFENFHGKRPSLPKFCLWSRRYVVIDRKRRITSTASNRVRFLFIPIKDRVIGAEADGAIVGEDEVGDSAEGFESFFVRVADRGAARVAAGHDEEFRHFRVEAVRRIVEQEHLERSVGEHEAELLIVQGYI